MAAETFQIKADSLQEARELAKRRILAGFHVLSERVISDGKLMRARGVGKTSAEASANARRNVPSDANIGHESEVSRPGRREIDLDAYDERTAEGLANNQIKSGELLEALKLSQSGNKGFLGFGRTPNKYRAYLYQQSEVEIEYKVNANIEVTIGKSSRTHRELDWLSAAERNGSPVRLECQECGQECLALPRALEDNAMVIGSSPSKFRIASQYCKSCNIIV